MSDYPEARLNLILQALQRAEKRTAAVEADNKLNNILLNALRADFKDVIDNLFNVTKQLEETKEKLEQSEDYTDKLNRQLQWYKSNGDCLNYSEKNKANVYEQQLRFLKHKLSLQDAELENRGEQILFLKEELLNAQQLNNLNEDKHSLLLRKHNKLSDECQQMAAFFNRQTMNKTKKEIYNQ